MRDRRVVVPATVSDVQQAIAGLFAGPVWYPKSTSASGCVCSVHQSESGTLADFENQSHTVVNSIHWQHRPAWLRVVNALGRPLAMRQLTMDSLMRTAARRARSDDFGTGFETGLARLLDALNGEARLNLVGWLAARTYLLQLLTNRALLEADRRRHLEIEVARVRAPLVITGLPRTGSTLLFDLLAQDPRLRAPMTWEATLPSPPPRAATFHCDGRIRRTQRMLDQIDRIAPRFQATHPVGATLPQECIAITAHAFQSIVFHILNDVASYQRWLNDQPLTAAYDYHRRFLQHLQAFAPEGRWLLKAPGHLFGLDALFGVYPDALVIVMHRDPTTVMASLASHCASLRQAFSERLDLRAIGRSWTDLWALGWRRQTSFRQRRPELDNRFLDVTYDDLMAAPMEQVAHIYSHFDLAFDDQLRQRMMAYLAAHPQHGHGRHTYALEDFDLTEGYVREQFVTTGLELSRGR